jgi:phage repressor protein C with HTH and peptisase S24 domain
MREYAERLTKGETIQFRPRGNSMQPKIQSGQLVTIVPIVSLEINKHDIVFCKVNGRYYVHLVSAVQGKRFQISNNKGHINGWVTVNSIFGKVINIED